MKRFALLVILFLVGICLLRAQDSTAVREYTLDTGKVLTSASNVTATSHAPKYSSYPAEHTVYVYICTSKDAYTYHKYYNCQKLDSCNYAIIRIPLSEAKAKGFRPCKICCKKKISVRK